MSHKLVSLYIGDGEYHTKTDVDNVLAEKDQEIAELKLKLENLQNTYYKESVEIKLQIWERCKKAEADASETQALLEERNKQVGELNAKLDSMTQQFSKYVVDANNRERRLKRALYKACANWADVEVFERTVGIDDPNVEANRWALMRNKCLKKAEEYK